MTDQEFEKWYTAIKGGVSAYEKMEHRVAVIAGYFGAMIAETTFTATQVAEILKLRNKK